MEIPSPDNTGLYDFGKEKQRSKVYIKRIKENSLIRKAEGALYYLYKHE